MHKYLIHVVVVVAVLFAIGIGIGIYAWSGAYDIGADAHHTRLVLAFMTLARNRSIDVRARNIEVPNLDDPSVILKGAGQYAAMCTQCHLRPGVANSEQREGMYPLPPDLSQTRFTPQREFWAIKHGIKMSGMPAWGVNHDDPTIWSIVAFLQKLPGMTPAEYKAIVAKAPPDEDMDVHDNGDHGHADAPHSHAPAPGMNPTMPTMSPAAPASAAGSAGKDGAFRRVQSR